MNLPGRRWLTCLGMILLLLGGGAWGGLWVNHAGHLAVAKEANPQISLSEAEKNWLSKYKSIRVAFDGYFPPYSFLNEQGEIEGLAVDVMEVIRRRTGIDFEISSKTVWSDLYEAAQRREVDVVATMGKQPEREQWFAFTRPYIFKSLVIMTREETTGIKKPDDLNGKRVALVRNYQYVKRLLEEYPRIRPHYVDTMLDGLNAVAVGEADAAITFLGVGEYLQNKHQMANLKFAAVFERDRFTDGIGVRKDWPELVSILDKAIASIPEDEITEIGRRWAGAEYETGIPLRAFFFYLAVISGGGFFLVLLFVGWNKELKRQVRRKTNDLQQELAARRKAEEASRHSEERFRAIFNAANDAVFIHDLKSGAILDVNEKMCEMFGMSREEALSSEVEDLSSGVPPFTQDDAIAWIRKAAAGKAQLFEWQAKNKAGQLFWVEVNMRRASISDEDRIIVTARDIGERKRAEENLRKSELLLRLFVEYAPAAIAMFDREMRYLLVSRRFLKDYNLGDQKLIGRSYYEVFSKTPERLKQIHRRCLAGAVEKAEEDVFFHADGATEWVRWEIRPWYERQENIGGLIWFSEVITDRIKAKQQVEGYHANLEKTVLERTSSLRETQAALVNLVEDLNIKTEELETANARLKELDRLKSMFIASMSHELRTPLNSIIGFSGIMLQGMSGRTNDEQRDQLERVFRAGKHLLSLITDVIDIAKIESGRISPYPEQFDLIALIDEAVEQIRPQAAGKGLLVEQHLPGVLTMFSDRKRLLQCLLNYLSNAVKFSEKGVVTVEVVKGQSGRVAEGQREQRISNVEQEISNDEVTGLQRGKGAEGNELPDGWVEIAVRDTGIGIRTEDMPLLFGSFVRLESHLKTTTPGTGLGLYLTRKLATEVLAGEVGVTSREGEGSRFWLRVPRELKVAK